jgi:hypothetical protein
MLLNGKEPKMSTTHDAILAAIETYVVEHAKFEEKGVKASAARARAALGDLAKLSKVRRAEIQEKKLAMSAK